MGQWNNSLSGSDQALLFGCTGVVAVVLLLFTITLIRKCCRRNYKDLDAASKSDWVNSKEDIESGRQGSRYGSTSSTSSADKKKRKKSKRKKRKGRDSPGKRVSTYDDYENGEEESGDGSSSTMDREVRRKIKEASLETPSDQALLMSFLAVLSEGITVKLHRNGNKPKDIKLWLDEFIVKWCVKSAFIRKVHKMHLREICATQRGKESAGWTQQKEDSPASDVPEALCFSLSLVDGASLDIECNSKMEREALVQGFAMIVHDVGGDIPEEQA